ncbi:SymE family type I addiction module toxin [Teredinibacter sp. KSP-S5-2]|uniref:SymE family type I addiction module toxin n=1 Tax=Teredinibacter sp. KSP-S5-2 TaxID=3034506 RepID=UPI0029343C9F|nr:SymE family type I addiction module toxin [Teredinibacter sp. KSP-S5-2]WNO08689.1 SymE family type I addiction module toxin [Teredinibacter sp. KSP-S5-2]
MLLEQNNTRYSSNSNVQYTRLDQSNLQFQPLLSCIKSETTEPFIPLLLPRDSNQDNPQQQTVLFYWQTTTQRKISEPKDEYRTKQKESGSPKTEKVIYTQYPPIKTITRQRQVPVVYLQGYWLEQAGFTVGTYFTVEVIENSLVLTAHKGSNEDNSNS